MRVGSRHPTHRKPHSPACACDQASELSADHVWKHLAIKRQVGNNLLQLGVLVLKLLQPSHLRAQAVVVQGDSVLFESRGEIAVRALTNRLPACGIQRELADAGFLLTYGADIPDAYRRLAGFVDKIFKGAKPADLPVEQPTKLELVINGGAARALGLEIPPSLRLLADEVIE